MRRVNGKNSEKDRPDPPAQALPMYHGYTQRSKRTNRRPSKGQKIQQIYTVRAVTALFIILALFVFVCCFLFVNDSTTRGGGDVGSESREERRHFNAQVEKRSRAVTIDIASSAEEEHLPPPSKGQNIQQIYIVRAVTALFIILALFVCCFLFESSLKTHGDVGSKSTEERHHFNDQVEKRSRVVAIDIAASAEEEHPPATITNKEEEQRSTVTSAEEAGAATHVEEESAQEGVEDTTAAEEEHLPATITNKEDEQRSTVTSAEEAGAATHVEEESAQEGVEDTTAAEEEHLPATIRRV
eukprot:CAMPEP_0201681652 /NCGR_PEP_ID=MMETSP0494-20130426/51221_1 /ASSEMBLY_ACC=CAM_ASM_000839 /TAXON_ID=420259 /ORGANISM="Thalassiosira gravida, Strain GMp14c1" /LENGTH=298 /DNA_ID=CAMNT_0048165403 /DNA_START=84 /DNA_END=981 /DNA_ORIENTATION=-